MNGVIIYMQHQLWYSRWKTKRYSVTVFVVVVVIIILLSRLEHCFLRGVGDKEGEASKCRSGSAHRKVWYIAKHGCKFLTVPVSRLLQCAAVPSIWRWHLFLCSLLWLILTNRMWKRWHRAGLSRHCQLLLLRSWNPAAAWEDLSQSAQESTQRRSKAPSWKPEATVIWGLPVRP